MRRGWIVSGVIAARASLAHASPVHLVYDAPAGCPDQAAFEASVRERAPDATLAPSAARTFAVAVTATADGFAGTLTTPEARTSHLEATRCDDVVLALALMTALAIEPAGEPAPPTPPPAPAPPPPPPPPPWHAAALIAPELELDLTPGALPAATIEGRIARGGLGHADLGAVIGRATTTTTAGDARFTWLVARASACWTPLDRRLAVDLCGHVEGGMLEAQGVDVIRAQDVRRSWLAAGAHIAARWTFDANLFAELRVGASAPFLRDRFTFTPNVFVSQASAITPWLGVGVGVRFW